MQIKGSDVVSRCNFGCKIDTDQYDHRVASITARDRFYILSRAYSSWRIKAPNLSVPG
jgi:hypothetical protein